MKVVTFETTDGKIRYLLVDAGGVPIEEVKQFLKFEDNRGMARNTLKQKCIHLKHFYTFLQQKRIKYKAVTVDDLATYIAWLKYPDIPEKVIPLNMEPRFREQCINANVDTVIVFYNYLLWHEDLENTLSEKLVKFVRTPGKGYRSFLYGIAENKRQKRYLLHLPVPKNVLRTVNKEEVNELLKATNNVRDYFLLYLLFETGMRIGEALSLWLEDSLSVSDVVVLTNRGSAKAYYVDSMGFAELPDFIPQRQHEVKMNHKREARHSLSASDEKESEPQISFYVAECTEFHILGEYHEDLSLQEAAELYQTIPADRMNGIKGIGFRLEDGSIYDGTYELMTAGKMQTKQYAPEKEKDQDIGIGKAAPKTGRDCKTKRKGSTADGSDGRYGAQTEIKKRKRFTKNSKLLPFFDG